jgi:hypothetical protein
VPDYLGCSAPSFNCYCGLLLVFVVVVVVVVVVVGAVLNLAGCRVQSCMKPATDIFISSQQMVASIVVLPLMYGDQNLGGLYFTLETPSNFQNIKDMLMGFVNSIVLVLLQKLEGQLHQMWDVVVQVGEGCDRGGWS